jgi:hypothetical protein
MDALAEPNINCMAAFEALDKLSLWHAAPYLHIIVVAVAEFLLHLVGAALASGASEALVL